MNTADIDRLVARVQRGDRDAFGELVFAMADKLKASLSAHAVSPDVLEDVYESTLIVCYENIQQYELRGTFVAWVKGIARNLLRRELEAKLKYLPMDDGMLERLVIQSALDSLRDTEGPEQEKLARLEECVRELPEAWQELVRKRYFEKLSIRELAQEQNKSETAIAVTLFRIRDALRKAMMKGGAA